MQFLEAGINRGGVTIAGAKDVAAANDSRRGLTFQNTSDTDMWLTETNVNAAVGTGYKVAAGVAVNIATNMRVSVYCASAGKTYAATEF
jgi:hypothetical protein